MKKTLSFIFSIIVIGKSCSQCPSPTPASSCPSYLGCAYVPLHYYTFDNTCAILEDCYVANSAPSPYLNSQIVPLSNNNPKVGGYQRLIASTNSSYQEIFPLPFFPNSGYVNSNEYTFEFIMRINSDFYRQVAFHLEGNSRFLLADNYIGFQAIIDHPYSTSAHVNHTFKSAGMALSGVDRLSTNYYQDYDWHHFICRFNGNTGKVDIWVDGKSSTNLTQNFTVISPGARPHIEGLMTSPFIEIEGLENNGSVDFDEIVFYDSALPDNLLIEHYNNVQAGQHYACVANPNIVVPPLTDFLDGSFSTLDYAPNHSFNSNGLPQTLGNIGSTVPYVVDQFRNAPLPRYKKGHGLNPNINWTDNEYLGRLNMVQDVNNDIAIQTELAENWNYMFSLGQNVSNSVNNSYQSAINAFANSNLQYKYSIITNVNFLFSKPGVLSSPPDILPVDLSCPPNPNNCCPYRAPNNNTLNHFAALGQANFNGIVNNVINASTPLNVNISYISENGIESSLFELKGGTSGPGCPYIQNTSSYNLFPKGSWTWEKYFGRMRDTLESKYRNQFIGQHARIPTTTKYSVYQIASTEYREDYSETRKINSPYVHNGNTMYYSTHDFYPTTPDQWMDAWPGRGYGWNQILPDTVYFGKGGLPIHRKIEMAMGDSLFSPFVAAGWESEFRNMRPGQWLGFLKGLGVIGADFYHSSYFNVTKANSNNVQVFPTNTTDPVDPRAWCYQLLMPSYAQAITSRFEKFLHSSNIFYRRNRNMTMFVIRRNVVYPDKYLIYGSLQKYTNLDNNTPATTIYKINDVGAGALNGLKCEIRRQGSTFIYNPTLGVFYQLDKWHDSIHPWYWSKDFEFEAELNDYTGVNTSSGVNDHLNNTMGLRTEVPLNTPPKDFTDYTTFIDYSSGVHLKSYYYFQPRDYDGSQPVRTYYVWVRARSTGSGANFISKINMDIRDVANNSLINSVTFPCIDRIGNTFKWYRAWVPQGQIGVALTPVHSVLLTTNEEYEVLFTGNGNVQFDKFIISENPGIPDGVPSNEIANITCAVSNKVMNMQETEENLQMTSIHPNPNNGKFEVEIKGGDDNYIEKVKVFNVQGQQVYEKVFNAEQKTKQELNLEDLANGVYFVEVSSNTSTTKSKILISK